MQSPTSTSLQHYSGQLAEYDVLLSKLRDALTSGIHTDNTFLSSQPFSPLAREYDKGKNHIERLMKSIGAQARADDLLSLTQILNYYGLVVPQSQTVATLTPLIRELEERGANHRLDLENGPDIGQLLSPDDHLTIVNEISLILGDR